MALITKFIPGGLTATDTVAGGLGSFDALSRGYPASISNIGYAKVREFELTFNLAAVTTGPAVRAATTPAVGDVIQLINIPKNHAVLATRFEVLTPDSTSGLSVATCSLSDGSTLLSGIDAMAAAGTQFTSATPKVYTTAATISLIPGTLTGATTLSNGMYRIVVLAMDMTGQDNTSLITG